MHFFDLESVVQLAASELDRASATPHFRARMEFQRQRRDARVGFRPSIREWTARRRLGAGLGPVPSRES